MHAVVLYESMYGNTRAVAEAVGEGIEPVMGVEVLPVADVDACPPCDLLVLGAPTHAWNLPRPSTRKAAVEAAAKPDSGLTLEPHARQRGIREWLDERPAIDAAVAVFDTRIPTPMGLNGSAARRAAAKLRHRHLRVVDRPVGFHVTRRNVLVPGELERARRWGADLAARVADVVAHG